jgi:antitoxin (DNA-binding transcriptional repressor) of toxin-antitoxin stability system
MGPAEQGMASISIRQLGKHTSICIREIERGGKPVIVKREGEPVAFIVPLEAAAELGLEPDRASP